MKRGVLLILLVIAVATVGCGDRERRAAAGGQDLVIAFDTSPTNLDPRVGTDQASGRVGDLIHAGLIRSTNESDYAPDLAESWETPDDTTIVFKLRPNLRFHNGQPLTARDVKFTYDSLMAEEFQSAKKSGYVTVAAIEAPDDQTVIFRLSEPNAGIFDNLTLGIVPTGADAEQFKDDPIGAGPYRLIEFRADERVVMEAFEGYYGGTPSIGRVVIRVIPDATTRVLELRNGSVNFVLNAIPLDSVAIFERDPEFKVVKEPGSIYQYLAFNLRNQYLRNEQVRQALAHAIDRQRIVRDLLLGYATVTDSIFPEYHWAHAEGLPGYEYDPQRANQMLDQAGFPDPPGPSPRFRLVYKTSTDAEANQQAQIIQQMLQEVGVEIDIQSFEFGVFYEDIQKGNFDMFSLRRAGVADPDFLYVIFHSENLPPEGQNRGFYVNQTVDRLIEEGRSTFDKEQRREAYQQVQRIVAEELPYYSLYHRYNIAIMDDALEGYEMHPAGFLLSIPKMRFAEGGE